jgi:CheY-like chemotaxis protein
MRAHGKILVVEDNASARELTRLQLQGLGFDVMEARDGEEALGVIARERPAAIVSDILMPRMDGFALAQRLRTKPDTATLPIIFLSATYVSAEDEHFALNLGALRFLPKPAEVDVLAEAVRTALDAHTEQPPLTDREFYVGYRQRLKAKLQEKADQITRTRQQLDLVPDAQRETYRYILDDIRAQHAELERELDVLSKALQAAD